MVLTSVIFVVGLSGVSVNIGDVQLKGMVLAAIVAMVLSLIFHVLDLLKWSNDTAE